MIVVRYNSNNCQIFGHHTLTQASIVCGSNPLVTISFPKRIGDAAKNDSIHTITMIIFARL